MDRLVEPFLSLGRLVGGSAELVGRDDEPTCRAPGVACYWQESDPLRPCTFAKSDRGHATVPISSRCGTLPRWSSDALCKWPGLSLL